MTLEDKVHATRLLALQRAEELGNVSEACRALGIFRSLFYRWKDRFEATVGMDCTRDAKGLVGDVLPVCRCRMSRRFWPWLCRTPPAGRVSTRCSLFATTTDICRPVPSIERCHAWGWAPDSSDSWSWNNTVPGGQACSQSVHDGSWHVPVVRGGTWKPRSRVSLSVWTPFTSVDSKGWVRSGRSQPVMRPARMPRHASSPPIPLSTPLVSLWTSSCSSTKPQDGRFSESSPIGVASLGVRLMPSVKTWRSAIRARNPGTRGPMVSSNVFRERSSTSIGVWPSAGDTSRSVVSSSGLCKSTWPSTTMNGLIKDIEHAASGQPTSSGVLKAAL